MSSQECIMQCDFLPFYLFGHFPVKSKKVPTWDGKDQAENKNSAEIYVHVFRCNLHQHQHIYDAHQVSTARYILFSTSLEEFAGEKPDRQPEEVKHFTKLSAF